MGERGAGGLLDAVDRLLEVGTVVDGSVRLGLAGIDLARIDLRALLTGTQAQLDRDGRRPADTAALQAVPGQLPALPDRLDGEQPGQRGLAGLLLALAELLHAVLESQAVARFDAGSLTDEQAGRLGDALAAFDGRMRQLRDRLADLPEPPGPIPDPEPEGAAP